MLAGVVFHALYFVSQANATMQAVAPQGGLVMNHVEEVEQEQVEKKKLVTIIVNTRKHEVPKGKICFDKVVALSGLPGGDNVTFTVNEEE